MGKSGLSLLFLTPSFVAMSIHTSAPSFSCMSCTEWHPFLFLKILLCYNKQVQVSDSFVIAFQCSNPQDFIEMGMFPFNFCFILWLGLHTYTYHLEVIYVIDYIIFGFHFRMIKGRHYKICVTRAGMNLVGLGMVLLCVIFIYVVF